MNARSVVLWGAALANAALVPACTAPSPDALKLMESSDGGAEGARGGHDSGGSMSRDASSSGSSGDSDSAVPHEDAGSTQEDSGIADDSGVWDSGGCIRPPYQTTNQCSGIGMPGG